MVWVHCLSLTFLSEDAEGVFHTASPFRINVNDPQKDLVDPALNGTKNVLPPLDAFLSDSQLEILQVLAAVEKSSTVKVVVVTSSVAAILNGAGQDRTSLDARISS